jgi:anti-sigma factor RsiW
MPDRDLPVTQDELHAYVDGELPPDRRDAVEAWLAGHADDAACVAEWRKQAEAVRARYGDVAAEPVPARLKLDAIARVQAQQRTFWSTRGSTRSWRGIAATFVGAAFLVGIAAGWLAHGASSAQPTAADVLNTEALSAHQLYVAEVRHPIEVKAAEQHLMPWLSRRVGTALRAPDLETFSLKLLGGRLLPGPVGPAAMFMYESPTGERYTFYCSKSQAPRSALRYHPAEGVAAVQWIESDIGYVVSGPADRERLLRIAQTAYEQMDNRPSRSSASRPISQRGS